MPLPTLVYPEVRGEDRSHPYPTPGGVSEMGQQEGRQEGGGVGEQSLKMPMWRAGVPLFFARRFWFGDHTTFSLPGYSNSAGDEEAHAHSMME